MNTESGRGGLFAAGGSVLAAALSSACCWLPLVLIAVGASAVGAATLLEKFRYVFIGLAVILLAGGFYLNYFRKNSCDDNGECVTANPRLRRFSRMMLWISVAGVAAFALFPNYVTPLLGGTSPAVTDVSTGNTIATLQVTGMSCDGCAVTVEQALLKVSGVVTAFVDYDHSLATVELDAADPASEEDLIAAVKETGYEAAPDQPDPR